MATREADVATCMSLGFARDRVVLALGVANGSIDVAIEWLLARAEADDRAVASGATRSAQPSSSSSSSKVAPAMQPGSAEDQDEDDEAVAMIVSFGFSVPPARAALRECDGDTARAIQLLADRSDALPDATAASASTAGLGGGQQHAEDDYLCFGDQVRLTLQRHLALPCGATAGSGSGSGSGSKQPAAPRSSLNSAAPRARLGDLRGATAVFRLVHPDPRQRSHSRDGGLHRSPHDDTSSEMGPTATAVRHLSEVLLQCARVRPAKSASALLTPPRPVASSSVAAASKRNASHAGSSAVGNDDDENSLVDEDEFDACFLAMEGDGSVSCNRGGVADFFMKWRVRASGQVDDEDGTGGDDQSSQRQRPLPRALRNGDQCHFLSSLHSMLGVNPQGESVGCDQVSEACTWTVTRVHHQHQQHPHSTPAIKRSPAVSTRASPAASPSFVGLSPGSMAPLLLLGDGDRNQNRHHVNHAEDGLHLPQQQPPSGLLQDGSARQRWALLRAHFRLAALLTCRAAVDSIRERTAHTMRVLEATAATNADSLNAHECVACWEREPDTVLLDCGHVSLCAACARGAKQCPLCRIAIARFVVMRR